MPGERPTRTESIFVRSNVLPPLRPAPFFWPFPIFRHLVPPFALARSHDSPRSHAIGRPLLPSLRWTIRFLCRLTLLIVRDSNIECRYVAERSTTITLPGERRRNGAYAVGAPGKTRIREKRTRVKGGARDTVLCNRRRFFFHLPEIPGDLGRVDRKFVQLLNGQIDVRCATKVSPLRRPFLPRKRTLKSTVNHERLPTTVRGKSSLDRYIAFFEEAFASFPQRSRDNC